MTNKKIDEGFVFMKKKGQVGLEFMMVTGIALFTLIIFGVVLYEIMTSKQDEKAVIMAEDLVLSIRQEITFASTAQPGYYRIIELPRDIEGREYSVKLHEVNEEISFFELNITNAYFSQYVPRTTGSLEKGELRISKLEAEVFIEVVQ